jgi:hypothetical protein
MRQFEQIMRSGDASLRLPSAGQGERALRQLQSSLGGSELAAAQTRIAIERLNAAYAGGAVSQTRYLELHRAIERQFSAAAVTSRDLRTNMQALGSSFLFARNMLAEFGLALARFCVFVGTSDRGRSAAWGGGPDGDWLGRRHQERLGRYGRHACGRDGVPRRLRPSHGPVAAGATWGSRTGKRRCRASRPRAAPRGPAPGVLRLPEPASGLCSARAHPEGGHGGSRPREARKRRLWHRSSQLGVVVACNQVSFFAGF